MRLLTPFVLLSLLFSHLWAEPQCYVDAYPTIVASADKEGIVLKNGLKLPYKTSMPKVLWDEKINNADLETQLSQSYDAGGFDTPPPYLFDPGRLRYQPFFQALYGKDKQSIEKNLVSISWPTLKGSTKLPVTKVGGVDKTLYAIGQEIAKGMENGSLQAGSPAAKDLQTQYASTQMAMDKLLSGMRPPVAGLQDPAGLGIAPTAAKANTASTAGMTPAPAAGLPSIPEKSSTAALGTAAAGLPVLPAQAKEAARIQQIAQAMGLSQGDAVLNAITYGKARQLYALSNDYAQANDIFRAVAGSGDAAATARARARVQSIKTQAQALLPPNTTSNQTTPSSQVVLDLLGM